MGLRPCSAGSLCCSPTIQMSLSAADQFDGWYTAHAGNALGSIGGFCAGDRDIVDHQRLSGLGYCFSASLPPYLATSAICALQQMQQQPLVSQVRDNARHMRKLLKDIPQLKVCLLYSTIRKEPCILLADTEVYRSLLLSVGFTHTECNFTIQHLPEKHLALFAREFCRKLHKAIPGITGTISKHARNF